MATSDNRRNQRNTRSDVNSDLSSSFEKFSSSLDSHTKALNSFIKEFNTTMDDVLRSNKETGKKTRQRVPGKNYEEAFVDASQQFERSSKEGLTIVQKTSRTFLSIVSNVGRLVVNEIKSATSSIQDSYKSHLSSIASQMQWTDKRYSEMFNSASQYFQSQGLNKQFSPTDFAEALENVLSTGLRGDEAERLAYRNLITNKLIPAISTNTVAYRRMSKEFGDTFNEGTAAFLKYTEGKMGAEGFSEGKWDSMLSSLESYLLYAANGNAEKVTEIVNRLTSVASWLESNNLDADAFVNDLVSAVSSTPGSNSILGAIWGVFDPDQFVKSLTSDTGLFDAVEKYVDSYSRMSDNPSAMTAFINELGGDVNQAYRASAFKNSGADLETISEDLQDFYNGYNAESEWNYWKNYLQSGEAQSADDELTKQEENMMTSIGAWTSEVARFNEILGTVTSTLKDIATIWLFTSTVKGVTGGGSLLSGAGSAFKGLFSKSATAGGASSAAGSAASGIGLSSILGGGMIAGGAVLGIKDALSVGNENRHAGAGALSFLTGDSNIGLSEEEKINKALNESKGNSWVSKNTGIDWSKVGSNAVKLGLIGGGAGTFAGGPIGTAVGGAAGVVVGGVASVIDQLIESAKYNKLAKSSEILEESFNNLTEAQSDYQNKMKESATAQSALDLLKKKTGNETEDQLASMNDAFEYLRELYPSQIGNLESLNDLDSTYISILEDKIAKEKGIAETDLLNSIFEYGDKFQENLSKFDDTQDYANSTAVKVASEFLSSGSHQNNTSSEDIYGKINDIVSQEYGIKINDNPGTAEGREFLGKRNAVLNQLVSGGVIKMSKDGTLQLTDTSNLWGVLGNTTEKFINSHSGDEYSANREEVQNQAAKYLVSQKSNLEKVFESILSLADPYKVVDDNGNITSYSYTGTSKDSVVRALKSFDEMALSLKETAMKYDLAGYALSSDNEEIRRIYDSVGMSPSFKVGLNTVPYDDFSANLHKGEMVLTADTAGRLRNLSSHGGVDRIVSLFETLSKASAVDDTSKNENTLKITEAIRNQTESITGILNAIYSLLVKSMDPVSTVTRSNSAVVPRALDRS